MEFKNAWGETSSIPSPRKNHRAKIRTGLMWRVKFCGSDIVYLESGAVRTGCIAL